MRTQTMQSNINLGTREILSPVLLAFLRQKIKELGQEKNEQIIMESILARKSNKSRKGKQCFISSLMPMKIISSIMPF